MLLAILDVWLFPHEETMDRRTMFGHACDLLLFLPRITLAAALNFTAWVRLPAEARPYAERLLERLREREKIYLQELPLEIPNDVLRERLLAVLQVVQLVEVRSEKGMLLLRWSALAPPAFRSLAHHAHDEMAGMRRATVFEKKNALPGAQQHPALGEGDHL
jgi:hypothetical protein